nr:hypothetical protein [Tanacetum cinerariifolium]
MLDEEEKDIHCLLMVFCKKRVFCLLSMGHISKSNLNPSLTIAFAALHHVLKAKEEKDIHCLLMVFCKKRVFCLLSMGHISKSNLNPSLTIAFAALHHVLKAKVPSQRANLQSLHLTIRESKELLAPKKWKLNMFVSTIETTYVNKVSLVDVSSLGGCVPDVEVAGTYISKSLLRMDNVNVHVVSLLDHWMSQTDVIGVVDNMPANDPCTCDISSNGGIQEL